MASSSDEEPTKPFRLSNSKKLSSSDSVPHPNSQDRIRKKKPKSKSKPKTNKQRRRRRHSSSSSDSDSDYYSSQKRDKPNNKKKKRRRRRKKKEKDLAKPDKKKSRNKKRRIDTPSPSSTSPPRIPKSRKRRRSLSPSPSCSTCSSRGRSPPSRAESREERTPKLLRETEERWEDRDKNIEAYDDCPPSRNDEREAGTTINDKLGDVRFASVVGSANDDMVDQEEEEENSVGVGNARLACVVCPADHDVVVEEGKSAGYGDNAGKDAVDLELILRQKALENFRKFRGGLSANKESAEPVVNCRVSSSVEGGSMPSHPVKVHGSSDGKLLEQSANKGCVGNHITSSSNEVGITTNQGKKVKGSTNRMLLSEHTTFAKVAQEKKLVAEPGGGKTHRAAVSIGDRKEEALRPVAEGKLRNPNSNETSKPTVSHTYSKSVKGVSMQNEAKRVEESSNRLSSEQATLAKVAKDKRLVVETGGGKAHMDAASIGDGSIPPVSCPIKDDENCMSNEPMVNSATGSQFEQKSFCRVRDGETVQVKYKVYIPKKTPALARRQLQR